MSSNWNDVTAFIKSKIPEHSYKMWLEPLKFCKISKNNVIVACPNAFSKKQVVKKYGYFLTTSVQDIMGNHLSLCFTILRENKKTGVLKKEKNINKNKQAIQFSLPGMNFYPITTKKLRRDFTFDQFVPGDNCDLAYSAALSIASKQISGFKSLFLLSKTGLGKSHLAQAVGHYIISHFPNKQVYYVTAEEFTNEMITSYKNSCIDQFKNKYRKKCDVLLMDDVQYLSGKVGTQKELTGTLDFLIDNGKKIIFSSSELPTNIPKLSDKLKSRLTTALITSLDAPNFETRIKILQKKAKNNKHIIPIEVIQYLAGEIDGDVRKLENGLMGVITKASLLGINVDLSLAKSIAKNFFIKKNKVSIDQIKKVVCKYYNILMSDLISKSRKKNLAWPRQVGIYLAKRYTDHSLNLIGKNFDRYHATCLYAIKNVEKAIKNDPIIFKQLKFLSGKLEINKI